MCTENLALHQPAWKSSRGSYDIGAERAVDGLYTDLMWHRGQCASSTDLSQTTEWRVDIGGVKNIHRVFIQHATGMSMSDIISFNITNCYII